MARVLGSVMIGFIISIVLAYFAFRLLDWIFSPGNRQIREGDFVKEINGQYYIVRETEIAPEKIEPPVFKLRIVK
jgi:hypothetical protein